MVAQDVVDSIRLIVGSRGGVPAGQEDALVKGVRSKMTVPKHATVADLRALMVVGGSDILKYIMASYVAHSLDGLTALELGEQVFELFEVVAKRTLLLTKYARINDDVAQWTLVTAALKRARDGHHLESPAALQRRGSWTAQHVVQKRWCWWRSRQFLGPMLTLLGALWGLFVPSMIATLGRDKIRVAS